jgi:hypothetical protein
MRDHIGVQAEPPRASPARGPPLWADCDAQVGEGVQGEPEWDLAAQPSPEYDVVDAIIYAHLQRNLSLAEIITLGIKGADKTTARRVLQLIQVNEYKRRQAQSALRLPRERLDGIGGCRLRAGLYSFGK